MSDERSQLIRQSFLRQAKACADLGSPFTARICTLAAERLTDETRVGTMILGWPGNRDEILAELQAMLEKYEV